MTSSVTVLPGSTTLPAPGWLPHTVPGAALDGPACLTTVGTRPFALIAASAWLTVSPNTCGTWRPPPETLSTIAVSGDTF
jgi:hypothetical protein